MRIAIFLLLTSMAVAESKVELHPFLTVQAEALNNLGYTNPVLGLGGGIEIGNSHFLTESRVQGAIAHKLETKDGRSFTYENVGFVRHNGFLLGAGSKYSYVVTSQWSKGSHRPFAALGYDLQSFRLIARYMLPIFDVQNRLSGTQVRAEIKANRHLSAELTAGVYRFQDTRVSGVDYGNIPAQKHTGVETGLGLKYQF